MTARARVAVHKFSSCDGCQLAFLNLGPALLDLAAAVDIVHFAEAGPVDPEAEVDIAFVEGSITTPEDAHRIQTVRARSHHLVTIGACATAGGLQALRNGEDLEAWLGHVYAHRDFVAALPESTPIAEHVKVDFELWGCPINARQVLAVTNALLLGVTPSDEAEKVCLACKRAGAVCVMVTRGVACMGPVTRTGCGAICPRFGRDCYACYGPAEGVNTRALTTRFEGLGLAPEDVARRLRFINNAAPAFREAARTVTGDD
ncbi:MAG: sulfhydrogenase subunit delta [Ectothiorhodospiraceae bacterium]|nr:sulfhydrogenase subunit delta [Ectothiorhodospiraceae bacterium]